MESIGWIAALTFFLLTIFGLTDFAGMRDIIPQYVWGGPA